LARRAGARIQLGETVASLRQTASGVRVTTDRGVYEAGQVVVAAGAWAGGLLGGETAAKLSTWRQEMHWFAPEDPAAFAPERFPVFIWMHGAATDDWFYGFPLLPGESGVKVADERFDTPLTGPEAHRLDVDPTAPRAMWARHVPGRLAGVSDRPVKSAACLYTMAPGSRFQIGREPGRERVIVASACSGHGFKHSVAVGDLVAELATGRDTPALLAPFALA
jgi:sarcosine oxidase